MAFGAAEAFQPTDQVAGRNMPRDGFPMQGDQGGELGNADGRAAGKYGLERLAQLERIRGQGARGHRSASTRWTRSPMICARPAATRRSTTPSPIRLVPYRQPRGRRSKGLDFSSAK
ncbi:hypothetical protein [Bradyrhizobium japonicum]|uniref:hypothetical protein n=1 Tax=Bradyrhizobium japonicum TaxID=375 RepID=UPI00271462EF|nr:hypothetical protein [Bradyrhizobium japonicum]WLB15021.1 hypothetical protein QIH95_23405 [Bradyrhizobium japonicum]